MLTGLKTSFQPSLEACEARIVAAGGVIAAAALQHPAQVAPHHPATPHAPAISAASHHPAHPPKHHSHPPSTPTVNPPANPAPLPTPSPSPAGTTDQAWVELVNMTGRPLEYEIKLGPYAGGQFLTFDIDGNATQYRMSSLIAYGHRQKADFAIEFGNGPVTPLLTGISQHAAQGYYIFLDSNFQPYVSPFISSGP